MSQEEENDILINNYLNRTHFRAWKDPTDIAVENFRSIELYVNSKCNLACKYCYVNRYGSKLYPDKISDPNDILRNTDILMDWILENKFSPKIEIFSGEPLVQEIGLSVLEKVVDRLGGKIESDIIIPTNFTFLLDKEKKERVERILRKSMDIKLPVALSISNDGKYCEDNRPFRIPIEDPRDDSYYDDVFSFAKKWGCGFHPMIYSNKIEKWKDNFLWFQDMFAKYGLKWYNMYLLEVRNMEWNDKQLQGFSSFIDFLIRWTWDKCHNNPGEYIHFLFQNKGFNFLSSPFITIGRGIGCSFQSTVFVRLGDLSIVPCHRTSYEQFVLGRFMVDNGKITGVKAINPELWIGSKSTDGHSFPYCETCLLKHMCSFGCLGSQYETTGDLFTPIPTVCELEFVKVKSMINTYKELGILKYLVSEINEEKRSVIKILEEM